MIIKEALIKLNEEDFEIVPVEDKHKDLKRVGELSPTTDLDRQLLTKIDAISKELANEFEKENINLDPKLIAADIIRDCGLMGGVVNANELDIEHNPFDAATNEMHNNMQVDPQMACQLLLNIDPKDFARVFMSNLKRGHGMLPGGGNRELPLNRPLPHRIRNERYIKQLSEKYVCEDLKGYVKNHGLEFFVKELKVPENTAYEMIFKIAELDPTYRGNAKEQTGEKGNYFDWLIRMITQKKISYEEMMAEAQEIKDQLVMFDDLKRRKRLPGDKRDIMQFKTLEDVMTLLSSLGSDVDTSSAEKADDFKSVIKNIRGALISVCGFRDEEIPAEIKNTSDCLTLVCENSKWECWLINSIWGAMLADTYGIDWGAGATWCTGGQYGYVGNPRKGQELLKSAQQHYPNYTRNGRRLVFFTQKDKNVLRPENKAQINFDSEFINGDSFFHANDRPISLNENGRLDYNGGYRYGVDTSTVFAEFLQEENLLEAVKKSILGHCSSITDAENKARLEAGEPYEYNGGKIKDVFKGSIVKLHFSDADGKVHEVDTKEHPEYLKCETVDEMLNMERLLNGKAYIYNGEIIKDIFKPAIKRLIVSDDYNETLEVTNKETGEREEVVAIKGSRFTGCSNLEEVYIPAKVRYFAMGFYNGLKDTVKFYTPIHKLSCGDDNVKNFLMSHLHAIDKIPTE